MHMQKKSHLKNFKSNKENQIKSNFLKLSECLHQIEQDELCPSSFYTVSW